MRLHIATLGLHESNRIDYVVTKKGADKVIIICPDDNISEGIEIRNAFSRRGVDSEHIVVNPWKYEEILAQILETVINHIKNRRFTRVEFNCSCGTRVMVAASYMAALILEAPLYIVGADNSDEKDNIITLRPVTIAPLTEPKEKILEALKKAGGRVETQKDLGTRVDLRVDSVSKHIKDLTVARYVRTHHHARRKTIELTHLGEMVLELKRIRKIIRSQKRRINASNRGRINNGYKTHQHME